MFKLAYRSLMIVLALLLILIPVSAQTEGQHPVLQIPSIQFTALVVEIPLLNRSWDVSDLTDDVGHLGTTAWPDESGNVVLAGHDYDAFERLEEVRVGAEIVLHYEGARWVYLVDTIEQVSPRSILWAYPTQEDVITLITCAGANSEYRLIVRGSLLGFELSD